MDIRMLPDMIQRPVFRLLVFKIRQTLQMARK
jgi:hypothetical protein